MKQSEDKKSLSEKNPVADFIFFRGIYCVLAAPHSMNAGSVIQKMAAVHTVKLNAANKKCKERGDSVVELDNFKSTLQGYKAPLQEVRDSL